MRFTKAGLEMWCGSGSWPPLVLADEACVARLDALAEGLGAIGDAQLTVHVVGPPALAGHDLRFPLLQDADGHAAAAYRTGGAPTAFLLDPPAKPGAQ
jgi:hypothetical protein